MWNLVFICHIYMVILHGYINVEPSVHMSHLYGHSPWMHQCGAKCSYVTFIWSFSMEASVWKLLFICHIYMVILHGGVSVEASFHMSYLYGHSPWRRQCGAKCSYVTFIWSFSMETSVQSLVFICHIYMVILHGDVNVDCVWGSRCENELLIITCMPFHWEQLTIGTQCECYFIGKCDHWHTV